MCHQKRMVLIVIWFLLAAFLAVSCRSGIPVFDARKAKAGDTMAGMQIELIEVYPGADPADADSYMAIVRFRGQKELKGTLYHYGDQPLLGRSIVFEPDAASLKTLPRLDIDPTSNWFMVENYDEIAGLVGTADSVTEAIIIIDHYTINFSWEVVHTAQIVQIR